MLDPKECDWCHLAREDTAGYELAGTVFYRQLCASCAYCIKHGAPSTQKPWKVDPGAFTAEQRALESFTAAFFKQPRMG